MKGETSVTSLCIWFPEKKLFEFRRLEDLYLALSA